MIVEAKTKTANIIVFCAALLTLFGTVLTFLSFYRFRFLRGHALNRCVFFIAVAELLGSITYLISAIIVFSQGSEPLAPSTGCEIMGFFVSLLMCGKFATVPLFLAISLHLKYGHRKTVTLVYRLLGVGVVGALIIAVVGLGLRVYVPSYPDGVWCWMADGNAPISESKRKAGGILRDIAIFAGASASVIFGGCGISFFFRKYGHLRLTDPDLFWPVAARMSYYAFYILALILVIINERTQSIVISFLIDFLTPSFGFWEMCIFWWTEGVLFLWRGGEAAYSARRDEYGIEVMRTNLTQILQHFGADAVVDEATQLNNDSLPLVNTGPFEARSENF